MAKRTRQVETKKSVVPGLMGKLRDVDPMAGGGVKVPEGDYLVEVKEVTQEVSSNDNEMLVFIFVGLEKEAKGKQFWVHRTLTPESLGFLRYLLEVLGAEITEDTEDLDLEDLIGRQMIAQIGDDEYEGKTRSKIMGYYSVEDGGGDADKADSKPSSKKTANGKKETVTYEASEVEDMDEKELSDIIDKHDLNVDLGEHKTPRRKRAAVIAALEEEQLLAT